MTSSAASLAEPHGTDTASDLRLRLRGVAAAGVALGLAVAGAVLSGGVAPAAGVTVAVALPVGWSYLAVGLYAWRRRPDNPFGRLLTAVTFAWFAAGLAGAGTPVLHTVGLTASGLYYAVLVHLLLAFPHGRVRGRTERAVLHIAYGTATAGQLLVLTVSDPPGPANLLSVRRDDGLAGALETSVELVGAAVTLAVAIRLAVRWRAASVGQRRALAPVLAVGAALAVLLAVSLVLAALAPAGPAVGGVAIAVALVLGAVPYAFLTGLARTRAFTATAVTSVLSQLTSAARGAGPDVVRGALARALGDPDLSVAYWLPDRGTYVDSAGAPVPVPPPGRIATVVDRNGHRVAALVHDPGLDADPDLVRAAGAAAALGLDNERLYAELRARVAELEESRRRVLEAGESERRRLERDLHDGAQQRLVGLRVTLGLAAAASGDPGETTRLLDSARAELDAALAELRDLARGLHPAVLANRGLADALASLVTRSPIPVDLTVDIGEVGERLAPAVESTVYFVVAEALTNLAKHARATRAQVQVARRGNRLDVAVCDDGVGGADAAGSGLRGLAARVAAHDGVLTLDSPAGTGTVLRAELPARPASAPESPERS